MTADPTATLTVATYNALADAYVRPEYYPRCDPALFAADVRYPRLVERAAGLDADVICLQEVDHRLLAALGEGLGAAGYSFVLWAKKGGDKPDGCAVFSRGPWTLRAARTLRYDDGSAGHVAVICELSRGSAIVTIANTHLKWEAPDTPDAARVGLSQATQLRDALMGIEGPRIVCGDFNARHGSPVMETFRRAGFADAHDASVMTCAPNGVTEKIDHLLHTADLDAAPVPAPRIDGPIPSATEPSDHLPLAATFRIRGAR